MTQHPETRFQCNRCGTSETVPTGNGPLHSRVAGPLDWLCIAIGTDPGTPPSHLCPGCHTDFSTFMHAKKNTEASNENRNNG